MARFGSTCLVASDGETVKCRLRRSLSEVVCGDWVTIDANQQLVTAHEQRLSEFARSDKRGRKQIIAANIDLIVIVVAAEPAPSKDLINRYLVACQNLRVDAAIFLNKIDLLDRMQRAAWADLQACYEQLGYPFLRGSAKQDAGLKELNATLANRTAILVGQSGVGKSSLINRLVPNLLLRTREISDSTGKGRHTTTATTLYRLDNGAIIDSPGVWEYGIWTMTAQEVAEGFVEFAAWTQQCRFANCRHLHEPDCGLDLGVAQKAIDPARLASYRRIAKGPDR